MKNATRPICKDVDRGDRISVALMSYFEWYPSPLWTYGLGHCHSLESRVQTRMYKSNGTITKKRMTTNDVGRNIDSFDLDFSHY